jgi:hypothetical protein
MKRLTTWAVALVCAASIVSGISYLATAPTAVRANLLMSPTSSGGGGAPTGNCAESTAFFARVWALPAALDGTVGASIGAGTGHLGAYDALICNLNSAHDNVLPTMDALWVTATDDTTHTPSIAQQIANLNLKSSSFTLIPVGSPPFVANTGYAAQTESTTGIYLNTQFTPSAGGTNYVLGGSLIHAWTFTSHQSASQYAIMGTDDATQVTSISPWTNTTTLIGTLSDGSGAPAVAGVVANSTGSSLVVRYNTSGSPGGIALYRNGASLTLSPVGSPTVGLVTIPMDFGGENFHGTHYASPYQVAAGGFGGALTSSFISSSGGTTGTGLVPRICQYLTAVHGSC